MDELNEAVPEDRKVNEKNALKPRKEVNEEKEIKVGKTDSESGNMIRDGKPEGFLYLDHWTVDLKFNLITDVHVTPENVYDSVPYLFQFVLSTVNQTAF
jgi:hypothetical protein